MRKEETITRISKSRNQLINKSILQVALMAFDLLEVAVQESGEVVATFVLDRSPAIVERLGTVGWIRY